MSLYIQHGYGKANRITTLAAEPGTEGVILSPGDEDVVALADTGRQAGNAKLSVLLDPQTYIYSLSPAGAARKHADHDLDFGRVHWSQDAGAVAGQVQRVEEANTAVGISGLKIAPTCLQSTFADVWTPLALQYARTASAAWGSSNTLATLAIDEAALSDWRAIADWLDVATTVDVAGFYLLVARQRGGYPQLPWEPSRLTNLLRLIYNLSVVNEYTVIWGYSDIDGLLGLGAGANGIGSGWHYTLRSFTPGKWQPSTSTGGRPPAARVYLSRLWAPVRAEVEAASLYRSRFRDELFSPTLIQRFADRDFSTWTRSEAQEHHLSMLSRVGSRVSGEATVSDRGVPRHVLGKSRKRGSRFRPLMPRGSTRSVTLWTVLLKKRTCRLSRSRAPELATR